MSSQFQHSVVKFGVFICYPEKKVEICSSRGRYVI